MSDRAWNRIVVRDSTGAVQSGKAVTYYEADGTTPYAGSIYANPSGGSPTTTHTTDSLGTLVRFTAPADARPFKATVAGLADPVYGHFMPDPSTLLWPSKPAVAPFDGYTGTDWAVTARSLNALSKSFRVANLNDDTILSVRRPSASTNDVVLIGDDGSVPTLNLLYVVKSSPLANFMPVNILLNTTAGAIAGQVALQATDKQTVSGISNVTGIRGVAERSGSASAGGLARAVEGRIKLTAAGGAPALTSAFAAISEAITSGVAADAAYYAGGNGAGFNYGFYYETSASAHIASIDNTGLLRIENLVTLKHISTPSEPAAGYGSLYMKSTGLHSRLAGGAEQRHKAGGQYGFATGVTSGPTTASASYATLTDMEVTLTTTGGDLLVWFTGTFAHSSATNAIVVALALDGGSEIFSKSHSVAVAAENEDVSTFGVFSPVAAGSHTVRVRWLTDGATATAVGGERRLIVQEQTL